MATDPICGMSVDEKSSSLFIEQQGRKYYFCSTTCKIQFEKPEKELKALKHALLVAVPLTIIVFVLTYASKDTLVPYVLDIFELSFTSIPHIGSFILSPHVKIAPKTPL